MEQGLIRYFPQLPFGSYSKCQLLTHPLVTSLWTFHTLTSAHKPVMIHSEPLSCFILFHTVCLTRTPKAQSTCMVNPREQPKAVGRELSGHVRSSQLPATADSFILCCLNSLLRSRTQLQHPHQVPGLHWVTLFIISIRHSSGLSVTALTS